jgi:hypothetical protein
MTNLGGWDKGRLDHVTHEQIAYPLRVLTVGLIPFLWFGVLRVSKYHVACLFKDIEYRDPVLTGRFHADFHTLMLLKPGSQTPQILRERREASFKVLCSEVRIGNPDAGINPGFVDIQSTAIKPDDFEHGVPPAKDCRLSRDWLSGEIESTSEEISLRATVLRQSLMPLGQPTPYKNAGFAAIQPRHSPPRVL